MSGRRLARTRVVLVVALVVGVAMLMSVSPSAGVAVGSSPTGKIAFVSDRDGTFPSGRDGNGYMEVYRMNADGSGQVDLTNNPADDYEPVFSPDGSRIAFNSRRDGNSEIYRMNPDGSRQVNLTNNPANDTSPVFSPDGSKIAFTSDRDGNFEIYRMNADGSRQVNLTNNPANDDSEPVFSPDGSKIAFTSSRDGNSEIYRMNADGSRQVNLTNNPATDFGPTWGGRSSSAMTLTVRKAPARVSARGVLEPATVGNAVTVTLARKQNGRWAKVKAKSVAVKPFGDCDGDLRTDAQYRARFDRPGPGKYRISAKFSGDYYTLRSGSDRTFRLSRSR